MILNDRQIKELVRSHGMIEPFEEQQVRMVEDEKVISYGLSSFGYDIRAALEWKVFTNVNNTVIDPKNFDEKSLVNMSCKGWDHHIIIPPNSFALARSLEYMQIPDDIMVVCLGKSTYARCGIICNTTPLEPGWKGHITLEFSNTTPLPAKMYSREGVAQLLFYRGERPDVTYADRGGKYQGQTGINLPRA